MFFFQPICATKERKTTQCQQKEFLQPAPTSTMYRCRDGVKVLWFHSHPVWLVYEGSIPTCACLTFLLTVYMWSAPIVLSYSLKKTYMYRMTYTIYIYEKPQFNSLVWGSFLLASIVKIRLPSSCFFVNSYQSM